MSGKVGDDDAARRVEALERLGSVRAVARELGMHHTSLNRWFERRGCKPPPPSRESVAEATKRGSAQRPQLPGATITDTTAILISRPNPMATGSTRPEDVFAENGLDAAEWTFDVKLNRWDALTGEGGVTTLCQLTINARRRVRLDLLIPARVEGWRPDRTARRAQSRTEPRRIVVCSDPHHPYADAALGAAMCRLLRELEPEDGYDLGDGLDLPQPSRHRVNPAFNASPQECIDAEYESWLERISASPATRWRRLPGNHDERIKNEQLDRIGSVYGIRRAQTEAEIAKLGVEHPALDIGNLLRLDELGVEMIRPTGDGMYHHAEVKIADGLRAGHGTKTGKHGGAAKVGESLTCSWLQGHDHKQAVVYLTRYDDDGDPHTVALGSVGTLARVDLGYMPHSAVQQGLATVMVWPDGRWHLELARWYQGELYYRDQRY